MDPSAINVGQIASVIRDLGFFGGILVAGWKARAIIQPGLDFFIRARDYMDSTETKLTRLDANMTLLLTNHLSHLHRNDIIDVDQIEK